MDRIRLWIGVFLRIGVYTPSYRMDPGPDFLHSYLRNTDLLHDLLILDEGIGKEFVSFPAFSKLVMKVWTAQDADGGLYTDVDYPRRGRGCPIASFLHRVVEFEEGREGLLQHLLLVKASSPTILQRQR